MAVVALGLALSGALPDGAQQPRRKLIIDQDARGPATTDLQSVLLLLQSREVEPLGITIVSGDQWRDEEVAHTLRLLEIIGRTDVPVVPGAVFPLLNSKEEIERWQKIYGVVPYQGAWNQRSEFIKRDYIGPWVVPDLPEGNPTTKPSSEDAPHFLIRTVRQFPNEVTIYAGGPLTNLALALAIDPKFPELAKELVVMGGSINPYTAGTRFGDGFDVSPRREFNFWWDPEATRMVLRARWPKITVTPVDISIKTTMTAAMVREIGRTNRPAAQYIAKYSNQMFGEEFMWDELAALAWLDPTIITKTESLYMDIVVDRGAAYGDTLTWRPGTQPGLGEQLVTVQADLDRDRFYRMAVDLFTRPTPNAR
jgi:inosine-uridine nucleoside N-ribohydrolase